MFFIIGSDNGVMVSDFCFHSNNDINEQTFSVICYKICINFWLPWHFLPLYNFSIEIQMPTFVNPSLNRICEICLFFAVNMLNSNWIYYYWLMFIMDLQSYKSIKKILSSCCFNMNIKFWSKWIWNPTEFLQIFE